MRSVGEGGRDENVREMRSVTERERERGGGA